MCDVCCDSKKRAATTCGPCGFTACRVCARRCAVDFGAACPACKREWGVGEQRRALGASFATGPYRAAQRRRLWEREAARLEQSVPSASRERERRRLVAERERVETWLQRGYGDPAVLWPRLRQLQFAIATLPDAPLHGAGTVRCAACPTGRVDGRGVCVRCSRTTCLECEEEIVGGDHVCDPAAVASRQAIRRDCRPCVRCGALSARAEGCPVMWCVKCHAFWNWDTGRLIDSRRPPHNPDHRAWVASGVREVDDVPCGGIPDVLSVNGALMATFASTLQLHPGAPTVVSAYAALQRAQRLRHHYPRTWDELAETEPMRVAFLLGDVDEAGLGQSLERHERTLLLRRDVGEVLEAFVFSCTDVYQRFCSDALPCETAARELWAMHEVTATALARVAKEHGGRAVPQLRTWLWSVPYERR